MPTEYRYQSPADYLISKRLHVDAQLDDGWGAEFPLKGRELEATILFSDISSFSARTLDLTPVETLGFVNNFFSWITAEALQGGRGIVDKYIGDALMIVFSKEFGAEDPFVEAVQAARWMGEHDVLSFVPHIGIASGPVVAGYVGTPLRYDASVFGAPVALAARCAGVDRRPENEPGPIISTSASSQPRSGVSAISRRCFHLEVEDLRKLEQVRQRGTRRAADALGDQGGAGSLDAEPSRFRDP